MKVLLIYPELDLASPWYMEQPLMPPLGLAFLAGILRKHGYDVHIIDNTVEKNSPAELSNVVGRESFCLIGISCLSANYQSTIAIAKYLKHTLRVPIIIGGPHATVLPETLQFPYIDYICIGEGELTLLELCHTLTTGKCVETVKGLRFNASGEWIDTGRRALMTDLDSLPHPARDLLPIFKYRNSADEISTSPVLSMNTSRGCPFDCTFCSVQSIWGRRSRTFSAEWILEDIDEVVKTYHAQGLYFYEDNFTLLPKRVDTLCDELIRRDYPLKWACEGRIGSLALPLLKKMKKAGCETIKFGIESGSQRILDVIQKGITLREIRETRALCRKAGIKFACFILLGIPSETDEDRQMTLEFVRELQPEYLVTNIFIPTPKSQLYEEILQSGCYDHIDENYFIYLKEFEKEGLYKTEQDIIATWRKQHHTRSNSISSIKGIMNKLIGKGLL